MLTIDTLQGGAAAQPFSPRSTCVALGLFDGVHIGHQSVIDRAVRTAGERGLTPMVFSFTTHGGVPGSKRATGRLMSHSLFQRVLEERGVEALFCPDFREFREFSPEQFVQQMLAGAMGAGALVCGYDFHFGKGAAGNPGVLGQLAGELGIHLEVVGAVQCGGGAVSSTRIRGLIQGGEMEQAARLLGRFYAVDFPVIHGNHIGKTLGWPTINQPFPEDFAMPRFGVYATLATVDGKRHSAVTNVGVKPTVGSDTVLAETYIQDFSGDLYDRPVLVEFLQFVRPERKFESLDLLREQIRRDGDRAAEITRKVIGTGEC